TTPGMDKTSQVPGKERLHVHKVSDCARFFPCSHSPWNDVAFGRSRMPMDTLICCRNVRISASRAARDRNRSTTIQIMSLTRSLIPQQHRPILDQLLVGLSLRQGPWVPLCGDMQDS